MNTNKNLTLFNAWESPVPSTLFYELFDCIPCQTTIYNININKFLKGIDSFIGDDVTNVYAKKSSENNKTLKETEKIFILKEKKIIIHFDSYKINVFYSGTPPKYLEDYLVKFINRKRQRTINFVVPKANGEFELSEKIFNKQKIKIDECYNDDLLDASKKIISNINNNKKSGIHLFHGIPGTGKSTFIRYLIDKTKRNCIFVPSNLAANLDSPVFMKLLLLYSNSILIIEDAEQILKSRDRDSYSPVSSLLNISDGIIGECLNLQIICTFNTDIKNIDKAVQRKGRLLSSYEFKKLSLDKTNFLLNSLGHQLSNEPLSLADIYNYEDKLFMITGERKAIGFNKVGA